MTKSIVGDPHDCLGGKYKQFGKKIAFQLEKKTLNPSAQRKIKNSNYIVLDEKNAFRFNLGPREVPQPENMNSHFHAFSGWGTSQGPKLNLKAFFS